MIFYITDLCSLIMMVLKIFRLHILFALITEDLSIDIFFFFLLFLRLYI